MEPPCTAQEVVVDTYVVVVNPKPLAARLCTPFEWIWRKCKFLVLLTLVVLLITVVWALVLAIGSFSFVWLPIKFCHRAPGIDVQNVRIVSMTLSPGNATAASTPWQVSSDFNVTLSARNKNTVARCFTTFRTAFVDVRFRNNLIVRQAVPLGFSLKPRKQRVVSVGLRGEGFALKEELVPYMDAELRQGNVTLEFFFNTRYLIADRRSKWKRFGCVVVGKSPLVEGLQSLLGIACYKT